MLLIGRDQLKQRKQLQMLSFFLESDGLMFCLLFLLSFSNDKLILRVLFSEHIMNFHQRNEIQ